MAKEQLTNQQRAQQLRERAEIQRAEATELESDRNMGPNQAVMARQARELARNYDLAADRLDPNPGDATLLLAGTILLVSYVHVRKS